MACLISCPNTDTLPVADFIAYVEANVDRMDPDSIAALAPKLRAVANNRGLILPALHQQMRDEFAHQRVPTTQVVVLAGGSDFYVRVDLWPAAAAAASPTYQEQANYYAVGTGQSFPSLLTGYFGSGLIHDLYAYDPDAIEGYFGEPVSLKFVERVQLGKNQAALFWPHGEIVQRLPPETFSATVGLMIVRETGDMHMVDVKTQTLRDFSPQLSSSRREAMLRLAGLIGDANTRQYLDDLSTQHPCQRTRLAAYEALVKLAPSEAEALWRRAAVDAATLVQRHARNRLAASSVSG